MQQKAVSSHHISYSLGAEADASVAPASCQGVSESDNVHLEPLFLQTKRPQLPQLLLISLELLSEEGQASGCTAILVPQKNMASLPTVNLAVKSHQNISAGTE